MRYLLIGKSGKRRDYFLKACQEMNLSLLFFDIEEKDIAKKLLPNDIVKIDPIANAGAFLKGLDKNIRDYEAVLNSLANCKDVYFLNHPSEIFQTLDKKFCKKKLIDNFISTTPMLDFDGNCFEGIIEFMRDNRTSQIFVKPNFGSGAAGVFALRFNPKINHMIAYTTITKSDGEYVNTKKLHMITSKEKIADIADFLLQQDFIVERWIPKDSVNGYSYDLRIVYQFGHIVMIQARGAKKGVVTNLHLNNFPIEADTLNLSEELVESIELLCTQAMKLFPKLNSVGFDILIEKNSGKPYIIEMNAQGDLMYRDIFEKNLIYKEQARRMKTRWQEK